MESHSDTRVDTLELKHCLYQKIGHQRAEKYFDYLTRFLSLKLTKIEFDKACIQTIGKENIHLHNQLIRFILKNACLSKVPPPKVGKTEGSFHIKDPSGYQKSCLQSLHSDSFPQSPRRRRSQVNRDHKSRDRPSPLGPLGKSPSEVITRLQEQSATELHSLGSKPPVTSSTDGEEVEQIAGSPSIQSRSPCTPPLGISIHTKSARKALHVECGSSCDFCHETCTNTGELPDTNTLKDRLKRKLGSKGLDISLDCANVINSGVDVFMKRLIEPCIGITRSRLGEDCSGAQLSVKPKNIGISYTNQAQIAQEVNGAIPGRYTQRIRSTYASMLDFRVAMESNPCILGLGKDWPKQLEKISSHSHDE